MFQQKCINVSDPLKEGIFRMINLNDFIISQKTKDRHQTKFCMVSKRWWMFYYVILIGLFQLFPYYAEATCPWAYEQLGFFYFKIAPPEIASF